MSVSNWHRENKFGYRLDSEKSVTPKGIHIVELSIICDPSGSDALRNARKELLRLLLIEYSGNMYATSRAMGVSHRTIRNWLKEFPNLRKYCSDWAKEIKSNQ